MYRVIIADDEELIRKGIIQLMDWESLGCQVVKECVSGEEVITYLEQNEADILITDIKMPKLNGIELLEWIYEKRVELSVIMLTAYPDFSYAKRAIRYGAVDYVVKNDFIEELPGAIKAAGDAVEQRKKQRKISDSGVREETEIVGYILETLALSKIINNPEDIEKYGLDHYHYCICNCEILDFDHVFTAERNVQLLKNFMNTIVNKHKYYIVNVKQESLTLIICQEEAAGLCMEDIAVMCSEILRVVEEFMRLNLKFGVSTVVRDWRRLGAAYEEAVRALARSAASGNEVIFYVEEGGSEVSLDMVPYFRKITEYLFQKNLTGAENCLAEMKKEVSIAGYPFEKLKIRAFDLSSALFRRFGESYIGDVLGNLEEETYRNITKAATIYSVFEILRKLLIRMELHIETNQYEKDYLITQIDQFIRNNYQKNITLKGIAEAIHVSPAYVSRMYKKKTGITVTDAVSQIRMEQSKRLLRETSYKIYEIAEMVGIEDPAYFTNVFTKYTGYNPSEYRNHPFLH